MRSLSAVAISFGLLCLSAFGQEAKKVAEPDFVGVVFLLDPKDGGLTALERKSVEYETKFSRSKGMSMAPFVFGEKSPVRVQAAPELSFVVRVPDPNADPSKTVWLTLFEKRDGKRIKPDGIKADSKSATFAKPPVTNEEIKMSKYGESSLRIDIFKELPLGEYCIGHASSRFGFCFGVDPAVTK